jgi:hypothetical protein
LTNYLKSVIINIRKKGVVKMYVFISQVESRYATNIIGVFSTYENAENAIKTYLNDMIADKTEVDKILRDIKEEGYAYAGKHDQYFIEQYKIDG